MRCTDEIDEIRVRVPRWKDVLDAGDGLAHVPVSATVHNVTFPWRLVTDILPRQGDDPRASRPISIARDLAYAHVRRVSPPEVPHLLPPGRGRQGRF